LELTHEGEVETTDIFGYEMDARNGALDPGKLDLHITEDKHALALGNIVFDNEFASQPYLIERYKTVEKECEDTRQEAEKYEWDFPFADAETLDLSVTSTEFKVITYEFKLFNNITCPKEKA